MKLMNAWDQEIPRDTTLRLRMWPSVPHRAWWCQPVAKAASWNSQNTQTSTNPSTHQPINPSTHQPINAPPDTASHQTSRSKSPTSRCLLPLRIATAAQIHMIATIENLPPFGSSRRYQMQKSLLHQWSSRRTLACLDLKITHSPDTQRVIEKENTTSWWWTPQGTMNPETATLSTRSSLLNHFLAPDEAMGSQFPHRDVRSRWPLVHKKNSRFGFVWRVLLTKKFATQPYFAADSSPGGRFGSSCMATWSPSHFARSHRKRIAMGIPKGTDAFGIAPVQEISNKTHCKYYQIVSNSPRNVSKQIWFFIPEPCSWEQSFWNKSIASPSQTARSCSAFCVSHPSLIYILRRTSNRTGRMPRKIRRSNKLWCKPASRCWKIFFETREIISCLQTILISQFFRMFQNRLLLGRSSKFTVYLLMFNIFRFHKWFWTNLLLSGLCSFLAHDDLSFVEAKHETWLPWLSNGPRLRCSRDQVGNDLPLRQSAWHPSSRSPKVAGNYPYHRLASLTMKFLKISKRDLLWRIKWLQHLHFWRHHFINSDQFCVCVCVLSSYGWIINMADSHGYFWASQHNWDKALRLSSLKSTGLKNHLFSLFKF